MKFYFSIRFIKAFFTMPFHIHIYIHMVNMQKKKLKETSAEVKITAVYM